MSGIRGKLRHFLTLLDLIFITTTNGLLKPKTFFPGLMKKKDPRWRPLSSLLAMAYNRYKRPIVITETSHSQEHRPNWIEYIGNEICKTIQSGIPLFGVCLYPIIDRPDRDFPDKWHGAGLWDLQIINGQGKERKLYEPYGTGTKPRTKAGNGCSPANYG